MKRIACILSRIRSGFMRKPLTCLLAGLLVFIPMHQTTRAEPPPKDAVIVVRCVYVLVQVGTACALAYALKCLCSALGHMMSNQNWQLTNDAEMAALPMLASGSTNLGPLTFQSARGLGSVWLNECTVNLEEVDGHIVGTLIRSNVNIATLSVPIPTNTDTPVVRLDFSQWSPPAGGTNCPPVQLFRLEE